MFNFLFSNDNEASGPEVDIHIKSIDEIEIHVMAVIKGTNTIYINKYKDSLFESNNQGSPTFMGPVYNIELALKSGNYEIFYGVVTDDRRGMVMSLSNVVLDNICPIILDEMSRKYSSFSDFCNFYSAPTCYTYYLAITNSTFYITNNSGNDSFCIPLNKSSVTRGNRETVLARY